MLHLSSDHVLSRLNAILLVVATKHIRTNHLLLVDFYRETNRNKLLRFAPNSPLQAPFFQLFVPSYKETLMFESMIHDIEEDSKKSSGVHSNRQSIHIG